MAGTINPNLYLFVCHTPFLLRIKPIEDGQHLPPPTLAERVEAARRHLEMSLEWKGDHAGIVEMRRHYGNYFKGLPRFKEYKKVLLTSYEKEEVFSTLALISDIYSAEVPA